MIAGLKLIGLTGGIGSGKSTVARMLAGRGIPVLDADDIAREIVEPGAPAHAEIAAAWPHVLDAAGNIDRKRLAEVVFADSTARARLEAVTHPRIQELALARAGELAGQGHRLAVYEASLLVEKDLHRQLDGLIVVTASEDQQLERVVARDHCTPDEARARMAAQMPLGDKVRVATHVVDNGGDAAATRRRVDELAALLLADAGRGPQA